MDTAIHLVLTFVYVFLYILILKQENKINAIKSELRSEIDMRTLTSIDVYSMKTQMKCLENAYNLIFNKLSLDKETENEKPTE